MKIKFIEVDVSYFVKITFRNIYARGPVNTRLTRIIPPNPVFTYEKTAQFLLSEVVLIILIGMYYTTGTDERKHSRNVSRTNSSERGKW